MLRASVDPVRVFWGRDTVAVFSFWRKPFQPEPQRGQFRAGGRSVLVDNTPHPQTFGDLDEEKGVINKNSLSGLGLGGIQGQAKNIAIRLADPHVTGRDKGIHESGQLECLDAVGVQLAGFIADDDDFQAIQGLQPGKKIDHLRVRLRLGEHKVPELGPGKCPFLVKDHPAQIVFHRELALFKYLEIQEMAAVQLGEIQLELHRRPPAGVMIPTVGEQNLPDVQEQSRDFDGSFHLAFPEEDLPGPRGCLNSVGRDQ